MANGARWFYGALAVVVVAGAGLRLLAATRGFFADELFTYVIADRDSLGGVIDGVRTTENTPPLYYVLAWLSLNGTGIPELVRLPSLVAGVATIPVAALLGRRLWGPTAGIAAAVLIALTPFEIFYSSEARSYAPAAFAVLTSTLLLLEALERPRRLFWIGFVVSAAAAVWFHYIAVFPLAAQAVWAFVTHPPRRRPVLFAHLGAAALYAPWLPFAGAYVPVILIARVSPFHAEQLLQHPARVLMGHPISRLSEAPGTVAAVILVVLLAALLVLAARRLDRGGLRLSDPWVLLVTMALAAPAGLLIYSALKSNLFLPRNLIVSAPFAAVLIGGLIARMLRPRLAIATTVAVVVLLIPSAVSTAAGDLARPPYDDVARLIDERARPADPVIEASVFPVGSSLDEPLRRSLVTFLRRPHAVYLSDDQAKAWRAAERGGRAYALYPDVLSGLFRAYIPKPPRGSGFVEVKRRFYEGTPGLFYVEYERR